MKKLLCIMAGALLLCLNAAAYTVKVNGSDTTFVFRATDTDTLDIVLLDTTHLYRPYYTSLVTGATGGSVYERYIEWKDNADLWDKLSNTLTVGTITVLISDVNEGYLANGGYNRMYYCADAGGSGVWFMLDSIKDENSYEAYVIHNGKARYLLDEEYNGSKYIDYDTLDADGIIETFGELNTTYIDSNKYEGNITIPSYVRYKAAWGTEYIIPVVGIDCNAFKSSTALKSVVIQDGVKEIGNNAVMNGDGITRIELPSTLTSDGNEQTVADWNIWCSTANGKTDTLVCYMDFPFYYDSDEMFRNRGSSYTHYIFVKPYKLESEYLQEQSTTTVSISQTGWGKLDTLDNVHILPFTDRTISSTAAATVALPYSSDIPEGMSVYTLSAYSEGEALATTVSDSISADVPVYVEAAAGDYRFYGLSQSVTDEDTIPTYGCLIGTYDEDGVTVPSESYVLQNLDSVGKFYYVDSTTTITLKQYRAYLTLQDSTETTAAASSIRIIFDPEESEENGTTGITTVAAADEAIAEEDDEDAPVYNLQGMRVDADNLQRGIYIRKGKKFIVN